MRLGYELTIEQTQKLSMTPELIQAIQILQFNNQELSDYVQNELLENPVLEAEKLTMRRKLTFVKRSEKQTTKKRVFASGNILLMTMMIIHMNSMFTKKIR